MTPALQASSRRRIVAVSPDDGSAINLKQPEFAAFLAWLVPGLGHLYQGRTKKGRSVHVGYSDTVCCWAVAR